MRITVHNRLARSDVTLGVVVASGVESGPAPTALAAELEAAMAARRATPLSAAQEAVRTASRDILRNGAYKPTGRGKPASEYLMRAASEGNFPRINGPVDANNLISLRHCVAISVWDVELADASEYEFRLGKTGESYVFNPTGQVLELTDLVCGCALGAGEPRPIVTPIKDSLATKLTGTSRKLCGVLYLPTEAMSESACVAATEQFAYWLGQCGAGVLTASALCRPSASSALELSDS